MSLRLPPVGPTVSGLPRPQTIRWCLEPFRERSTGLGPVLAPPKRPHVRAVNRGPRPVDPVGFVELHQQQLVQPLPTPASCTRAAAASRSSPSRSPSPAAGTPTGSPSATRTRSRSAPSGQRSASDRETDAARAPSGSAARSTPTARPTPAASPAFRTRLTTLTSSANRGSLLFVRRSKRASDDARRQAEGCTLLDFARRPRVGSLLRREGRRGMLELAEQHEAKAKGRSAREGVSQRPTRRIFACA
jgi:hypothetical protein